MAIPVYLWLEDDGGVPIKGSVDVIGREGSIEVSELMHSVEQPTDFLTGKASAKHLHSSYAFMKGIDNSSSYLYKALSAGQTLKKAVFKFYRINHNGFEEEYFRTTLETVKVAEIEPFIMDVKNPQWKRHDHLEYVDLAYEKITWHYLDGNIIHSDSWKGRAV
ncbi:type VI secretion system tube protein TssD [Rosenbergiella nectarea]|uniref:type VI secretion system tube protein TssD n=1 Tax=Rosenbergiella nectarea TaxID=988801 RepID=UPI001F4DA98C|nr:type VI secretion system tube protein TssD [Rosenbergiella nectarea]